MKNKLPKYDKYKPSGVEWLGEIPEHWEVSRLGLLLNSISEKNRADLPLLSITRERGVILRDLDNEEENHNFIPDDLSNYKVLKKGEFGMNKMKAWQGSYGISNFDGIVSPAYYTFILEKNLEPAFFHISIRSKLYISFFGSASDGVRIGQWDLSRERMKQIPFLIPPLTEQTRIAAFLDRKTAQIDQAIGIKEKQIALLKERRQLMIHRAVTRGVSGQYWDSSDLGISGLASEGNIPKSANQVNPDSDIYHRNQPKLKPSGVEWIGDIPEHWEVTRLKNLIKDLESGVSVNASESESANSDEIGVLKTSCVYNYKFESHENKKVFTSDLRRVNCSVKRGSIIISRMNAPELVGASGYVTKDYPNLFLPDRLWQTVFHDTFSVNSLWLSKVLIVKGFRDCITAIANGSSPSMKNISKGDFLNLRVPYPSYKEQGQIVTHIETLSSKIATAISLKEQEIAKLKEYKSVLINGAVTGKVKVG